MTTLPELIASARVELGLPALAEPAEPDVAGGATTLRMLRPPANGPMRAADALPLTTRLDSIRSTIRSLGSKARNAAHALADIANGTDNILSSESVAASRLRQGAASALLGAIYVDAAQHGEKHMPRAPRMSGNRAELLVRNASFLPRLYADLESAKRSITVNQFNWEPDGSGARVAELLTTKARAGLDVRVVVDGHGINERGKHTANALQRSLEDAGVKFVRSGGLRPGGSGWEHRKLITVDDNVVYTGGLGFGAKYDSWTDLMTRVEGPAAAVAAASALGTHRTLRGPGDESLRERLRGLHTRIQDAIQGPRQLHATAPSTTAFTGGTAGQSDANAAVTMLDNRPGEDLAATEAFLCDAASAKRRFWASSTYITTSIAANALITASKRGVDVKLLVTSPRAGNDSKQIVLGRALYADLIDAGVEIFEWPGILHAKSWLRDDDVAAVGSMNLSKSSMARAREAVSRVEDPSFAASYARFHSETRAGAHLVQRDEVDGLGLRVVGLLGKMGLQF